MIWSLKRIKDFGVIKTRGSTYIHAEFYARTWQNANGNSLCILCCAEWWESQITKSEKLKSATVMVTIFLLFTLCTWLTHYIVFIYYVFKWKFIKKSH